MKKIIQTETANSARVLSGEVVSDKMAKTVVMQVIRTFRDPLYGKVVKRAKKYKVHDENQVAKVGDIIEAVECRPLSKTKHMMLKRVVSPHGVDTTQEML